MEEMPIDFESASFALQHSWEVHRQAFGPILDPAFVENSQVRILLINALNHISRKNIEQGLEILKQLHNHCIYDEDKAAWAFCVGLCFDITNSVDLMIEWYKKAGEFGHNFYLPYLKIAKAVHQKGEFEDAVIHYEKALNCLTETYENDREDMAIGSVLVNLTSCLTMLHRYDEAETAWNAAQNYPMQPGADATAAILYAAIGSSEKVVNHIEKLKNNFPQWADQTEEMTKQIINGTHPSFPKE